MTGQYALVALPLPLARPYTYRIPESLGDRVVSGARVVVPVRRRELIGLVVGVESEAPAHNLKDILAVPDAEPALSPALRSTAFIPGASTTAVSRCASCSPSAAMFSR